MGDSRLRHGRLVPAAVATVLAAVVLGTLGSGVLPAAAEDTVPAPSSAPAAGQSDGTPVDAPVVVPTAPAGSTGGGSSGGSGGGQQSEVGGGSLPGQRPAAENAQQSTSDAAPSLNPGFVDRYGQLWKAVQKDGLQVAKLTNTLRLAQRELAGSASDLAMTVRQRGKADVSLSDAAAQFTVSVRDLYITGSTDVDVMLGIMGSSPEDFLKNLDSVMYLRSATGNETLDYEAAQQHATLVESASANALIRAEADRKVAVSVHSELARAKHRLEIDQDLLQKLVSIAAPQTVVGKDGCPKSVLDGTIPEGMNVRQLCKFAVRHASTPQAAVAIKWALLRLGAPYACEGIGRLDPWRYDCSSFVSRAFAEGAGLDTAGQGWAPSTRNMVPWDGASLDPHYAVISPSKLRPGDLVLYDTCPAGQTCPYRHVVMYLGPENPGGVPMMAHTNGCGLVAHVEPFYGTDVPNLLGVRRVMALPGEHLTIRLPNGHTGHRPGR